MMPLVQSVIRRRHRVGGLLIVVVGLLIWGCATTRGMRPQDDSDASTKPYGVSVVYPYPQPVVFERARQAVEELEFTIEEAGPDLSYLVAQRTVKVGKVTVFGHGEILGVYFEKQGPSATMVTIRNKRKIAANVFAKDYSQDLHDEIARRLQQGAGSTQKASQTPDPQRGSVTRPSNPYRLTVHATPGDSSIKIMNIVPKYQPGMALAPGPYDILVTRPGYQPFRQWVNIRDRDLTFAVDLEKKLEVDQTKEVRVPPEAVGRVERRTALVIGNAAYPTAPLRHPVNDAADLAAALERLDFNVTLLRNATYQEMDTAIEDFSRQLRRGGVGVLYYAGHGIQREGDNYLIPVDARLQAEVDVGYQAVNAKWALERLRDAGNELNIVILDACRTNSFVRSWRSSQQGLAVMQAAQGTLIVYATEPGGVVLDRDQRNSIYTGHLLRHIETAGLPVEQLFKQVRLGVYQETDTKQLPWESSSLTGDFYFVPGGATN